MNISKDKGKFTSISPPTTSKNRKASTVPIIGPMNEVD